MMLAPSHRPTHPPPPPPFPSGVFALFSVLSLSLYLSISSLSIYLSISPLSLSLSLTLSLSNSLSVDFSSLTEGLVNSTHQPVA